MSLRIELSDSLVENNRASGDCSDQQLYNDNDNDWEQQLEQQQQQCCFPISRVSILGRGSSATVYKSVLLHKLR